MWMAENPRKKGCGVWHFFWGSVTVWWAWAWLLCSGRFTYECHADMQAYLWPD